MYVGSAFVSGFTRFGLKNYAKEIFDNMLERSAITMNSLMVRIGEAEAEAGSNIFNLKQGYLISQVISTTISMQTRIGS